MKIYYSKITLLCLLVSFASCTDEKITRSEENINLKFISSTVLEPSNPLFGKFYEEFKISRDGNYWVFADKIREKIFVFSNRGKFISSIGKTGRGPEGIERITGFDINESNEIFVYDSSQRMLKIFNIQGELINSNNFLEESVFGTTPMEMQWYEDKILTSIIESEYMFEPSKSKLFALIQISGDVDTLFGSFDPFEKNDNSTSFFNKISIDRTNNEVYSNLTSSPYVQKFDLNNFDQVQYIGDKFETFIGPSPGFKTLHF